MPHATETTATTRSPALRVFVVEDSRRVRELLTEQLNDIDGVLVVGTAESERGALEGLRQTPCDVVILDIKLSEGSGIGVLRTLDQWSLGDMTRIIFSNYKTRSPNYRFFNRIKFNIGPCCFHTTKWNW